MQKRHCAELLVASSIRSLQKVKTAIRPVDLLAAFMPIVIRENAPPRLVRDAIASIYRGPAIVKAPSVFASDSGDFAHELLVDVVLLCNNVMIIAL